MPDEVTAQDHLFSGEFDVKRRKCYCFLLKSYRKGYQGNKTPVGMETSMSKSFDMIDVILIWLYELILWPLLFLKFGPNVAQRFMECDF